MNINKKNNNQFNINNDNNENSTNNISNPHTNNIPIFTSQLIRIGTQNI